MGEVKGGQIRDSFKWLAKNCRERGGGAQFRGEDVDGKDQTVF